jgi:hypothetical protein
VADKTEQDFADLAVFYAQQKSGVNLADPALVGKGEKLFVVVILKRALPPVQVVMAQQVKVIA